MSTKEQKLGAVAYTHLFHFPDVFMPALLDPKLAFLLKYSLQTNITPFPESLQPYFNMIDRYAY